MCSDLQGEYNNSTLLNVTGFVFQMSMSCSFFDSTNITNPHYFKITYIDCVCGRERERERERERVEGRGYKQRSCMLHINMYVMYIVCPSKGKKNLKYRVIFFFFF